jgi:hypothetical protein
MVNTVPSGDDPISLLSRLVPMDELAAAPGIKNVLPSQQAVQWFARVNREALEQAGALYKIGGRIHADPTTFAAVALAVGRERKLPA